MWQILVVLDEIALPNIHQINIQPLINCACKQNKNLSYLLYLMSLYGHHFWSGFKIIINVFISKVSK